MRWLFFEHILLFIGRFLLFVLLLFALLCDINCQSNVYMKNKILLLGLFCCSLISAEAQVLLDKGTGKNSFPIVSSSTNAVICFDGKDGKFFQSGLERFKKEGKTLEKASSCDSVIQVYDYLEENKTAYIVMEYVPGITVQQRVERQGIFTPEEMLLVVEPLMNDLQKLHEKGMLHRDILSGLNYSASGWCGKIG